jgi:hypothetical protein
MIGIDSNYFLLPISVGVRFGSPMGELSGSHHPEEEVVQDRVPAPLFAYSLIDQAATETDMTLRCSRW